MEQVKGTRLIHAQQLEDVPELLQHIQSLLPAKEAARTCVLSKSWLRASSTTPFIRFSPSVDSLTEQNQTQYMGWIRRTIQRYYRDNLPVTTLVLQFSIHTAFRAAEELIMQAASKSSLQELHLAILAAAFTLPNEIFSSENLHTLSLKLMRPKENVISLGYSLHISSNPAINCVNLRVLELVDVHISEEVLHKLFSTCKLLEKIYLNVVRGLEKIKVNNLLYLQELKIWFTEVNYLEIDDVPCLRYYDEREVGPSRPVLFKMETMGSLRELYLDNVSMDDSFSDMIKSKFPCLESLSLSIKSSRVNIMNIRCVKLQSLEIKFWEEKQIEIRVYSSKLLSYRYTGYALPSLLFPTIAPKQIMIHLTLENPIDHLFFLKMREALKISSKFNIKISRVRYGSVPVPFNIDDVRTMVPATNVEGLFFLTVPKEGFWENSLIFDAVFSICHPMYVMSHNELSLKVANYVLELIVKGVMENCEIINPLNGRWVTLTSSSLSLLDKTTPYTRFKLSWRSP